MFFFICFGLILPPSTSMASLHRLKIEEVHPPRIHIYVTRLAFFFLSSVPFFITLNTALSHTHTLLNSLHSPSLLSTSLFTHTDTPTMHSSTPLITLFFFLAVLTFTTAQQPEETPLACYQPSCTPLISLLQDCKISIDPSTGNINFPVEVNTTATTDKCLCTQKIVNAYGKAPSFFCFVMF